MKCQLLAQLLAVNNVYMDCLDDYFIGGSHAYAGIIFFQIKNGFEKQAQEVFQIDK